MGARTDVLDAARVHPPGDILKRELETRGLAQVDLAAILGRPVQAINEIVAGKKAITPEMAHLLGRALDTSAEFWMGLETQYRLWLAKNHAPIHDVERRARLFQIAPVTELMRRGWIHKTGDLDVLEKQVLSLIHI